MTTTKHQVRRVHVHITFECFSMKLKLLFTGNTNLTCVVFLNAAHKIMVCYSEVQVSPAMVRYDLTKLTLINLS